MSILISVNPPYAGWLVDGLKKIEWRKKAVPPVRALIYETKKKGGCGMIIGEVDFGGGYCVTANTARDELIRKGMVDREFLLKYNGGNPIYANRVISSVRYNTPRPLSDFGLKRPPQSWQYV